MGSVLKATLVLGSGSAISLIAGFLSNKVYAVLVGPEGLGLIGLFQSALAIASIAAGLGLSSGLVRFGASYAREGDVRIVALRQAAWQIYWAVLMLLIVLFFAFSPWIAEHLLADSPTWSAGLLLLVVALSLAAGIQIGLLNAFHRVSLLAKVTAFSSVLGAVWGIGLVWLFKESALPWVILGVPLGQFIFSRRFMANLAVPLAKVDPFELRVARRQLLRFGVPFTGSQLAGSAVQLGMPFLVLHQLGQQEVGYYRAAALFSTAYIGFLLNALGQDFYPRLSALRGQRGAFYDTLDTQQRFVLLLGSPLVVFSLAFAPMVISLLFSPQFMPTASILQWQLLGDLFRFLSWTLGYAVLAALPSYFYLVTELLGGACLFVFSLWGMNRWGIAGLGVAWLLTYLSYLFITGIVIGLALGWRPKASNVWLLLCAVGVAAAVLILPEAVKALMALLWALVCFLWMLSFARRR